MNRDDRQVVLLKYYKLLLLFQEEVQLRILLFWINCSALLRSDSEDKWGLTK